MIPIADVIPTRTRPGMSIGLIAINTLAAALPAGTGLWSGPSAGEGGAGTVEALAAALLGHGGPWPLAVNLLGLWVFGGSVEDRLGHLRFLGLYLAAGLSAALALWLATATPVATVAGASGAIGGVLGGYLALYPRSRVPLLWPLPLRLVEVPAAVVLAIWFTLPVLLTPGTATAVGPTGGSRLWAQAGGLLTGVLLARLLRRPERDSVDWWGR